MSNWTIQPKVRVSTPQSAEHENFCQDITWSRVPLGREAANRRGPRVAVIGKRNILHWDEHVARAFADEGYTVRHYQVNVRPAYLAAGRGILKTISGVKGAALSDRWHASLMQRELERFRPELVFFVSVFFLPEVFLAAAHSLTHRATLVGWDGDAMVRFPQANSYKGYLDLLAITEHSLLAEAKTIAKKSLYLAYGSNSHIYCDHGGPRAQRIYFCGAWTEDRERLIRSLAGMPLSVKGPGWNRLSGSAPDLEVSGRKVSMQAQARDYATHSVVLNQHQAANNPFSSLNMRSFEAPSSGALLLSDTRGDLAEHYEVEEEVLSFANYDELRETARRCMRNPDWVARIQRRGQARVKSEHTYVHRIRSVLDAL